MVTEQPPVYENETIIMVFEGDCEVITNEKKRKDKFQDAVVKEISGKLRIPERAIFINDVTCGSIQVTFTIYQSSGLANASQVLKKLVDSGNISVTVDGYTFKASKLEVVRPTLPVTLAPTTKAKKNEIAFILYITFGALMGSIFIVGIIVLIVRCRKDRREGSFFLNNDTELRRFHGIPRASTYSRVNYYGEPVEMDATAADPNAEEEFKAGDGAYSYNRSPVRGRGKPTGTSYGDAQQEDKFNVGAMGMPEWKNLPKLSDQEVTVAESKEGIPKSSGSVGSRELLLDDRESSLADSNHAYDNPVLTFGDGPSGLDKE